MSIRRNAPCPCGSGKKFKQCHGALNADNSSSETHSDFDRSTGMFTRLLTEPEMAERYLSDMPPGLTNVERSIPPGFILMEDFIPEEELLLLCRHAKEGSGTRAGTQDLSKSDKEKAVFAVKANRVTEYVDTEPVYQELWKLIVRAYDVLVEYFDRDLAWIEPAGLMRYPTGGIYRRHADNSSWDATSRRWVRSLDRDFSLLIYLNDDFEGGAIYFNNFDLRIQPKPGMMVGFPSDHRYLHTAEEVTAGERYAIVSWSAADDVPKIRQPPEGSIVIKDLEAILEKESSVS